MKTFLASLLCLATVIAAAQPANNDFANRIDLVSGGSISTTGANVGATHQTGDPQFYNRDVVTSVWWSWTAPFNGPVIVSTAGSSFDTLLAVCTGSDITALTVVGSNDDYKDFTSRVSFNAIGGVSYSMMVAGYNGASGRINLGITVTGNSGCSYTLTPSFKSFSYTATNSTVAITTATGCLWSAISNDSWITITSGNTGIGNGTLSYSITANTLLTARAGTMTIDGKTFTVSQAAAPGCTYSLAPSTAHFTASDFTNSITMAAGSGCAWTSTPNASWITIQSGSSGSGNGTITYVVATNALTASRTGTITAGGQTHTITQDGITPCFYTISPSTAPFIAAGGTSNIVVNTLTTCPWTASSPAAWVTFSTTNGTGNGTVTYTVGVNTVTQPRSAILTVANNPFTVTQAAATCSYALTSASYSAAAIASSSTVGVTTTTGCAWTAVSNDAFITITAGSSGSGSGTVSFTVAANVNTTTRSGTMTIAGQTFTVNQAAAACIYNINPTSAHFTDTSQSSTVAVTAGTGCAWTAVSNDGFITVDSGTPGSGNGTVGYTVAANVSTSSRTGTVTIAGKTFTVTQDGTTPCTYSISPASCACASSAGSAAIAVTANTGCVWSVTSSDPSWLTFTPASGSGNGTVTYTITANPSSIPRTATLTIADQVFTVNQAGITCAFTLSPATASYTFTGGTGTATMTTSPGCSWSSLSDSVWITITAGSSGVGNGTISYTVASTTSTTTRTGRITAAGRVLNITQTGAPCTATLIPLGASMSSTGGVGIINLTESDSSCAWTASTNVNWISVAPTSGSGSASLDFNVLPTNQSTTRSGNITIAGQVFNITQSGDTVIPVVTLTAPANGSTVSNVITLTATATDDIAVSRVDFYYDSASLIGSDTTSPYSIPFNTTNLSNSAHTFYARAFDAANNQGLSATNSVTISNVTVTNNATWVQRFGSTGSDTGRALAIDSSGNIYLAASFNVATSFGGSTLTNAGGNDIALIKYATNGVHQWSVRYGTTGAELANALSVSPGGKLFLGGSFLGTGNFGGTNAIGAGNIDGEIACYQASDGSFNWSRAFGNTGVDNVTGVAADSGDNVIVCGTFQGTINLGGTNLSSVNGATDLFLAKYSSTGTHIFSKSFPNDGDDLATGVSVDSGDNILLTGYFTAFINFGGGNLVSSDPIFGGPEVFIAKFDSSGAYVWANRYGSNKTERAQAIALDGSNNIAISGTFTPYTDLGGGVMSVPVGSTASDLFNGKFANSNGAFQWAKQGSGTGVKTAIATASDSSGNVISTGNFKSTLSFSGSSVSSVNLEDIYVVKYSNTGALTWLKSFGGSDSDIPNDIAVDSNGYIVVTGFFSSTCNFAGVPLTSAGAQDAFLIRLAP